MSPHAQDVVMATIPSLDKYLYPSIIQGIPATANWRYSADSADGAAASR